MYTPPTVAALALALGMSLAGPASAVLMQSQSSSNFQTGFDAFVSTGDLIQSSAPTLGSVVASLPGDFSYTGANNGNAAHTSGLSYWGANPGTVTLTYTLAGSVTGYDISSVNSIYGWQDVRYRHAAQRYEVWVQTVLNPVFTQIAAVDYHPWAANDPAQGATQVTLTDTTGYLATGVTAIRFQLHPYMTLGASGYTGEIGVVRELDVFGTASSAASATVPEPGTLALFGLAFAGLLLSRRKAA